MSLRNFSFYFLCSFLLLLLSFYVHNVFFVLLIGYYLFCFFHQGWKKMFFILFLTILFFMTMKVPKPIKDPIIQGTIEEIAEDFFILKTSDTKIKIFSNRNDLQIKDEIKAEVRYLSILEARNENAFNYKRYLYSLSITNQASLKRLISKTSHPSFYHYLEKKIKGEDEISSYASLFLLGVKDSKAKEMYDNLVDLSIVHLFALSGMHIQILFSFLKKLFNMVIYKDWIDYVILGLLGIYVFSIPYNISFCRAYGMLVLKKITRGHLNSLECLSICACWMLFFNPYVMFHLSFIFSYFMTVIVILLGKNKYTAYLLFLGALPIILSTSYRINITSILLGVCFLPFIKYLYLSFVSYFFLGNLLQPFLTILLKVLSMMITFSNAISVYINFSKPNLFFILTYYFIYFSILLRISQNRKWKDRSSLLLGLLVVFYLYSHYPNYGRVVMIDQTTLNMIQDISSIIARKPMIIGEI